MNFLLLAGFPLNWGCLVFLSLEVRDNLGHGAKNNNPGWLFNLEKELSFLDHILLFSWWPEDVGPSSHSTGTNRDKGRSEDAILLCFLLVLRFLANSPSSFQLSELVWVIFRVFSCTGRKTEKDESVPSSSLLSC